MFYRSPDDGKGSGTGSNNPASDPPATNSGTGAQASGTGNVPGDPEKVDPKDGNPQTGAITFASEAEFQKALDEKLKDRLERERKKTEEATKKAAAEAAAEAAKKNGEWQVLAEQREKEIGEAQVKLAEIDKIQEQAKRYQDALQKSLEVQRAGLPEPITADVTTKGTNDTNDTIVYLVRTTDFYLTTKDTNDTKIFLVHGAALRRSGCMGRIRSSHSKKEKIPALPTHLDRV
ncbi:MAG: hypothetical protein BGO78_11530 [Chloroflexi bacterium 44-23]|nr:MAG: hypothetical protein BGO78_11530 [Chloroflexi bacterium 44-23]